jgi:glycosyltransferase involved in cell wall biosynthesis
MKIAVYCIALNEEQFVKRWYESAKEADFLLLADTGSTDGTKELAESLGITVVDIRINPWRFDDARNASLAHIPLDIDYCIALDVDEVLTPGWKQHFDALPKAVTRPRYKYVWSWNTDGSEGLVYGGDKIHARKGYRWKHPVHEVLNSYLIPEVQEWFGLQIHHHPDNTKSRSQYFPMLEMAVAEDPEDDRNAHYLGREYFFHGMCDKAKEELQRHLSLKRAVWKPERAASMRYIAKCSEGKEREEWLKRAATECPEGREPWVDLAEYYYEQSMWKECYASVLRALEIKEKPLQYLNDPKAWGSLPYDLAALSAHHLGYKEEALTFGEEALNLSPTDERLKKNLKFYKES